ncbi:Checkpoint protein [Wickerhamomyces ciferrii]|uniref:Checkpoint protein n=1 Tax=Wickerhamomyces ciferrii (strain ATCC 14091 / BCRC 22168 / CBS 111 / JCM 3599 / NBRC 0793 / NRRL Y-1031 F-60-10) TaxID=1206466 RepID=K0KJE7_WICCF|nr:Checkpoint protein [Wickerhamomyces ciferrii]CCH43096.1 Checkpoint protein [Wickerhamomyces ciferrii]
MPRARKKLGSDKEVEVQPRRSKRSVKQKPIQVINLTDDEDEDTIETIETIEDEPKPKKQKISALRNRIRSFSATPQTTRSPTPDPVPKSDLQPLEDDKDQWVHKYTPKTVNQVALHNKKLKEVKEDIEQMVKGSSDLRLLVLSGPAGASKSTIASCLGKELVPEVRHSSKDQNNDYVLEYTNDNASGSSITQFSEFLMSAKYRMGKNLSLILVEDLPNVFHEATREDFQKSLFHWIHNDLRTPPLIICITECEFSNDGNASQGYNIDNNYTAETILGRKLLMNPRVKRIKFNPVNTLLTKRVLKDIKSHEPSIFKSIGKSEIDEKIKELSEFGDIRSSISAFQFWAEWKFNHPGLGKDMLHIGKESSVSLFHAIGKCLFGSKNEGEDDLAAMDKVMKNFASKPTILKLGLLENYSKFNKSDFGLETAANISDGLSLSDLFGSQDTSLEIATRSTRTHFRILDSTESSNTHAATTFPREWKANKSIANIKSDIQKYIETEFKKRQAHRSFQDSNLFYGFYEPIINKQRGFKNKSMLHYLKYSGKPIPKELQVNNKLQNTVISERLGGPFREIFGDGDIVPDEEVRDLYFQVNQDVNNDSSSSEGGDSEFDDDPIADSDDETTEDFGQDDTFEKELVSLSQKPNLVSLNSTLSIKSQRNAEFLDDFEQDDDFDDSDF